MSRVEELKAEITEQPFWNHPANWRVRELVSLLESDLASAKAALADALGALMKLTNEVKGSLPLMEPLCRREFGNTNYNILIQRADEADAVLARHKDSTHE